MKRKNINILILFTISLFFCCKNSELEKNQSEIDCSCILDDLTQKRISYEIEDNSIARSFEGELSPEVVGSFKEIIDLDILLRLRYKNQKESSNSSLTKISKGISYSPDFIEKYMLERGLFCAKYQAICKDTNIIDSLKTIMYINEIERLGTFLRENTTKKGEISPTIPRKTNTKPGNQINQKIDSSIIKGDNITIIQGDNSVFDNRKTYIKKKLEERTISDALIIEISNILKRCKGTNVDIRLFNQERETQLLADRILQIIRRAGLKNVGVMYTLQPTGFLGARIYMQKDFNECHALILNQLYYKLPELGWEVVYLSEETNLFEGVMIDIGGNPANYSNDY